MILQEAVFEDVEATSMGSAHERLALEGFGDDMAFTQEMEACWSFGPLRACASVVGTNQVKVSASLLGHTTLSSTLSARRTRVCASPSIGVAKAQICIVLDIRGRQIRVEGRLCFRRITWSWRCSSFNARLLSW